MRKIKRLTYIIILSIFLVSCSFIKKSFENDKKNGTDEFLVEKKKPLTMPPNFEKLPLPNTVLDENKDANQTTSNLEKILKSSNNVSEVDQNQTKSNSIESLILKEIKK